MKRRKTLSQQTLERLATLYEYAGDDPAAGDEEMGIEVATPPAAAVDDQERAAESERLLRRLLRAHEGDPAGDD